MEKTYENVALVLDAQTFVADTDYGVIRLDRVMRPELFDKDDKLKQKLCDLIEGRKVEVNILNTDRIGRRIADVNVDGMSVNEIMRQEIRRLYGCDNQKVMDN
ncbi:MAG: hypothetical protein GWN61_23035 [candidate division Zixibacteria bacterium]|nr:thermonuclease family protein [candidate division Zixibacteria bacterium]NIR67362.1 thermonuclease family protein [candidate division Zixibacteria bacterium]NIS16263.1 thermonuclease family protein [candidate division Zixibacteria bacterium]NIS48739.1 thermonuclease family protein [candidate division Zixibacteria bacterium]NIU16810.1 thermonuclease family protein [candidate division Zixibacteria bacterium]